MYQLVLPEKASKDIEALLRQTCPVHIQTTLDGAECPLCVLESRRSTPVTSPWVKKAEEGSLPAKVYR